MTSHTWHINGWKQFRCNLLQVLAIDIKKDTIINYVRDTAKKENQADRLEKAIITINEPRSKTQDP